jgi:hypothetical protein
MLHSLGYLHGRGEKAANRLRPWIFGRASSRCFSRNEGVSIILSVGHPTPLNRFAKAELILSGLKGSSEGTTGAVALGLAMGLTSSGDELTLSMPLQFRSRRGRYSSCQLSLVATSMAMASMSSPTILAKPSISTSFCSSFIFLRPSENQVLE